MATIVEEWLTRLEEHGCRITLAARAVVEVTATSTRALRPGQVLARARMRRPCVSPHTVRRLLARLAALGLIQRVPNLAGPPVFLAAGAPQLPVVICERCGEAEYVESRSAARLIGDLRQQSGFVLRASALQVYGVCAQCQAGDPPPAVF